jgi:hypothetical protein
VGKQIVFFDLDGLLTAPLEWEKLDIIAAFEDQVQPTLSRNDLTFVNEAAKKIQAWNTQYPFQGMPFVMQVTDNENGFLQLSGCIDFTDMYEITSPVEVKVRIKIDATLDLFESKLPAVSFGYLARKDGGIISDTDYTEVPVVVKKKFDTLEVAFTSLALFVITKEIIEFSTKLKERTLHVLEYLLTAPLSKPGKLFYLIGFGLLQLAYAALMLIAVINMIKVIAKNLAGRKTIYKGTTLRKLLEKACQHFGLELGTNIAELDYYVYLPSKMDDKVRKNRKLPGVPNNSDYGYQLDELFELLARLFTAQWKVLGKKLYVYPEKDPFWSAISTYELTDVLREKHRLNLDEMIANYIISFQYDPTDEYTMPNQGTREKDTDDTDETDYFNGVNCQVITDVGGFILNDQYKLTKGLREISIPMALGTRRDKLSAGEQALKVVLSAADLVIKIFGGKTFGQKINEHRGALIISQPSFNIAKLIVIQNGLIPKNHRDLLSASKLRGEYHWWRSFVLNPDIAQKKIYEDVIIPFDFKAFTQTTGSSIFSTGGASPKRGKFRHLKWTVGQDFATATFEISEKYASNLTETIIEA